MIEGARILADVHVEKVAWRRKHQSRRAGDNANREKSFFQVWVKA